MIRIWNLVFSFILAIGVTYDSYTLEPAASDFLLDLDQILSNAVMGQAHLPDDLLDIQYAVLGQFYARAYHSGEALYSGENQHKLHSAFQSAISNREGRINSISVQDEYVHNILIGRDFYDLLKSNVRFEERKDLVQQFYNFAKEYGVIAIEATDDRLQQIKFLFKETWTLANDFAGMRVTASSQDYDGESYDSHDEEISHDALVSYKNNRLKLHQSFSKAMYEDIKQYIDLAHLAAKRANVSNERSDRIAQEVERSLLNQRIAIASSNLSLGWAQFVPLLGSTGRFNQIPDHAAIFAYHPERNVIVIAFHGSLNQWDWEANYDFLPFRIKANRVRSTSNITMHRGFATNYFSVESEIKNKLESVLLSLSAKNSSKTRIFFVGHSKGAAIATIAAVMIRTWINGQQFPEVHISAVLFSSPRVFMHETSRTWVHKTLGKGNILRISVLGDFIPSVPPRFLGYKSVGVLLLDGISHVHERMRKMESALETQISAASSLKNYWQSFHYVCNLRHRRGGEFTPGLTLDYESFETAFIRANTHIGGDGNLSSSFFDTSFLDSINFERTSIIIDPLMPHPCAIQ